MVEIRDGLIEICARPWELQIILLFLINAHIY